MYGKYVIKIMLEIKGKCNSTLVHTFWIFWCWIWKKTLLPLSDVLALLGSFWVFSVLCCSHFTSGSWMSYSAAFHDIAVFYSCYHSQMTSWKKILSLANSLQLFFFFPPTLRYSCLLIPFYICSYKCLIPSLFLFFSTFSVKILVGVLVRLIEKSTHEPWMSLSRWDCEN